MYIIMDPDDLDSTVSFGETIEEALEKAQEVVMDDYGSYTKHGLLIFKKESAIDVQEPLKIRE